MKEIISIISFAMPKELCKDCIVTKCRKMLKDKTQCYLNRKPYVLVENKVPETFEDLKELCLELNNKIKDIDVNCVYNEHIIIQWFNDDNTDIDIYNNGTICVENHIVAENRTPQQLWEIIKNLIGEE